MNILYLINYAGSGGTEKYVYNLIEAFDGKVAKCHFAYNVAGRLSEQLSEMGVSSLRVEMRHPFDVKAAKTIAKYCRDNNIDVIHTHYPRENAIAVMAKKYCPGLKVVNTYHIIVETGFLKRMLNLSAARKTHKIIAVCNTAADFLVKKGYKKDKIEVIYNGIKPHERTSCKGDLRKELGIDEDAFVMTTLTRYHPLKGVDYLIKSISELKKITDRKFVLLIVGDGELMEESTNLINELNLGDCIRQLGFRSDASEILKISDLYINSSLSEALSFAILEAMDSALPVIATKVGGNVDIVSKENDCGILVEYGNTIQMAEAMNTLINDNVLRQKYAINALKAIDTVFNLDELLKKTFETYK